MSARRVRLLTEMGLAPVWRVRTATPADDAVVSPAAAGQADPVPLPPGSVVRADSAGTETAAAREARIGLLDWGPLLDEVHHCRACGLCESRTQAVPGVGDRAADWLLVGEAPGAEEDRLGEPFVGQAGRLLDNMLAAIGLSRGKDVYIANVLKCRPPGNRNPEPGEVARCAPFLERQVQLIEPRLIVAMGRFAAQALLGTDASIASLRGRVHRYRDTALIVTYHPAYLLRNLPDKAKAWEDLLFARDTMRTLRA